MSNPNFLTANTSGIELMPGINDTAVGYDVNRVIQALNGTNITPITTGNLTVSGTLSASGVITSASEIEIEQGNDNSHDTLSQIELGWSGDTAAGPTYQNWLSTRHNGGSATGNQIKLWTSDGTRLGVFPTNAILGMTIENGTVTIPSGLTVSANGLTVSAGGITVSGLSQMTGGTSWTSSSLTKTLKFAIGDFIDFGYDQSAGSTRFGFGLAGNGTFGLGSTTQEDTSAALTQIWTTLGTDFSVTNRLLLAQSTSKIVPGATQLSIRNNADTADNMTIADGGGVTLRTPGLLGTWTKYRARAHPSAATSVTLAAVQITLGTVDYDPNSNFASNQYTVPVAGYYLVNGMISINATTNGLAALAYIYKNNAVIATGNVSTANGTFGPHAIVVTQQHFAVNDTIQLYGSCSTATNDQTATDSTYLEISYLGN